jgi:serine/threonine protein kinase
MRQDSRAPALDNRPRIESGLLSTDPSEEVATLVNTQAPPRFSVISSVPLSVTEQDFALDGDDEDDTAMVGEAALSAVINRKSRVEVGPDRPGGFELINALGTTSSGRLYIGEKPMAFGVPRRAFLLRLLKNDFDYTARRARTLAQARIGAAFHHPNLVSVEHAGEDQLGAYVAFEHLEGTNLARVTSEMRERKEALPFEVVAWIVAEVLRGLHHAHELSDEHGRSLRVVVGELCPANVLISRTGQVKLATFALQLSRADDMNAVMEMAQRATAYLAPESLQQQGWTRASDVYAIGRLLYELLVGHDAFEGRRPDSVYIQTIESGIPLHTLGEEDVPVGLQKIVARATNADPAHRFADAQAMATALNTWLHDSGRHAMPSLVSRFMDRHGLYEGSSVAFGLTGEHISKPMERATPERSMRMCVEDLFPGDTVDDIPLSVVPEDTLSAMIIREDIDPDLITVDPLEPMEGYAAEPPPLPSRRDDLPPPLPSRRPPSVPEANDPTPVVFDVEPNFAVAAPAEEETVPPDPVEEVVSALHRVRTGPNPMVLMLLGGTILLAAVTLALVL